MISYSVKSIRIVSSTFRHAALTHCSLPTLKHQRNLYTRITLGRQHAQPETTGMAHAVDVGSLQRAELSPCSHEAL